VATKVEIANVALTALGADPISDLNDPDNENSRKVKRVYDTIRRSTLRKHFWNFAMKEIALSRLTDVPILDDYTYVFQLPPDYVRLKKTDLATESGDTYKIKGKRIYCNSTSLKIEYVYDCDDPNEYDSEFIMAFAGALADILAYPITTNATMAGQVKIDAKKMLDQAKSSDSMEETPDKPQQGSWIRARR
jgi:hypothetical protein